MIQIWFGLIRIVPKDQNIEKTKQQNHKNTIVLGTHFFFLCVVSTDLSCIPNRKGVCMDNKKLMLFQIM